jgi:hypothetical protein
MVPWEGFGEGFKDLDTAEEAFRFFRIALNLGLKDNIQLNRCTHGLPFLGFRIFSINMNAKSI